MTAILKPKINITEAIIYAVEPTNFGEPVPINGESTAEYAEVPVNPIILWPTLAPKSTSCATVTGDLILSKRTQYLC